MLSQAEVPLGMKAHSPGYSFHIQAVDSAGHRGTENRYGPIAIVHVSDDGYVTISLYEPDGENFPEPMLGCVAQVADRVEILR